MRPHADGQLARRNRLEQVLVRVSRQPLNHAPGLRARRENEDGDAAGSPVGAQRAHHVFAHRHVGEDDVRGLRECGSQRQRGVGHGDDLRLTGEGGLRLRAEFRIGNDDEDAHGPT